MPIETSTYKDYNDKKNPSQFPDYIRMVVFQCRVVLLVVIKYLDQTQNNQPLDDSFFIKAVLVTVTVIKIVNETFVYSRLILRVVDNQDHRISFLYYAHCPQMN